MTISQIIQRDNEILSQGLIRVAGVNTKTMRPQAFPAVLLKELQAL
jgi:acyl-CoA thioesterase FadM